MLVETDQAQRATDRVEWLAALCQLRGANEPRSANPHLLTLLHVAPGLPAHPALACVKRLRAAQSRDQLVKVVVRASYARPSERGELYDALSLLSEQADELLGSGPALLLRQAHAEVEERVREIAGPLDPAADLAEVTGERVPLRVVLAPSIFLPPPQGGRHGAMVQQPQEWIAHLHFGFPLRQPPAQFSISRPWLLGGGWHYAIHLYLDRYWPDIARRIAEEHADLAEAVSGALPRDAEQESRPFADVLRAHVNVALKCLLSRRLGVPDGIHRAFARARGLALFPWFDKWLLQTDVEGAALAAYIQALPDAMAGVRADWERLARSGGGAPPTVNLALVSPSARQASLVVPDDWTESAVGAAVAGWRLMPLPVVRYTDWQRGAETRPAIAFGEPERNPLVRRVLEQRGLDLAALQANDPAIIALSTSELDESPWCVAVAVRRPETAAGLRMEMALRQTHSYVVYDGGVVVGAGRVSMDDLAPVG